MTPNKWSFLVWSIKSFRFSFFFFALCQSAAISYLLDDWTGVEKEKAKEYILNCQVIMKASFYLVLNMPCSSENQLWLYVFAGFVWFRFCSRMMVALVYVLVWNLMVGKLHWFMLVFNRNLPVTFRCYVSSSRKLLIDLRHLFHG